MAEAADAPLLVDPQRVDKKVEAGRAAAQHCHTLALVGDNDWKPRINHDCHGAITYGLKLHQSLRTVPRLNEGDSNVIYLISLRLDRQLVKSLIHILLV